MSDKIKLVACLVLLSILVFIPSVPANEYFSLSMMLAKPFDQKVIQLMRGCTGNGNEGRFSEDSRVKMEHNIVFRILTISSSIVQPLLSHNEILFGY